MKIVNNSQKKAELLRYLHTHQEKEYDRAGIIKITENRC